MLIDQATIFVRSGKGGNGCCSFLREKYRPKGGPDGGNGGRGGDVVLVGDRSLTTLLSLTPRPHYRASNGGDGQGKSKFGADAEHRLVPVPLGTIVRDRETGEVVCDIAAHGERVVVAVGGAGGRGNESFKSATNQTPREVEPGSPWQERTLDLELKLIADVGLVGLPNAGKSTFLAAVTQARPKIADYPFTTLEPSLGIHERSADRRLLIADIPGLIEGAAQGAGLGHEFLRHIERTSLFLHLVDACPIDGSDPVENWAVIRAELAAHEVDLSRRPEVVLLNKSDLTDAAQLASLATALKQRGAQQVFTGSTATGAGMEPLLEALWSATAGSHVEDRRANW
ncbi:MAG: GTPase ObgE [Phycisphaerales bacterium]|nr:GTPase ObgE [Phycisphaerales bacterium]